MAGVSALVLQAIRRSQPEISRLDAAELVYDTLTDTAVDFGEPGRDNTYGAGQADALAAVERFRPEPGFYFLAGGGVRRANFRSQRNVFDPSGIILGSPFDISGIVSPKDIVVDPDGGKLYWTEQGRAVIRRANLDGSGAEDFAAGSEPVGLAITGDRRLVWADASAQEIQMAELDGYVPAFASGFSTASDGTRSREYSPANVAVDLAGGRVYWTEPIGKIVRRADFTGNFIEDIFTGTATSKPYDIALDPSGGKVYWSDLGDGDGTGKGNGKIYRADLDGANREELYGGLNRPYSITLNLHVGKIYWTDPDQSVMRANLDGSSVKSEIFIPGAAASGIALVLPQAFPPEPGIYFLTDRNIHRADFDGSNVTSFSHIIDVFLPDSIAVDPEGGKMYWTEGGWPTIRRANLDGSGVEDFLTVPAPTGLAIFNRRLYWTDAITKEIHVASLNYGAPASIRDLFSVAFLANDIAVDREVRGVWPRQGLLDGNFPNESAERRPFRR